MMFKRLQRSFQADPSSQRPSTVGYEAIDSDDATTSHVAGSQSDLAVEESGRAVYWCFWALGAGVLLSWNVLICSFPLLASFFPEGSSYRANLASHLSTTYCFGNLLFLGIAQISVSTTIPTSRISWSLLLLIVLSLLCTVLIIPKLIPDLASTPSYLLSLLMVITALLSISTAYLQSGVFALSALWPTSSTSSGNATLAVMSGQGGIAVLVSGVQLALAIIGSTASDTGNSGGTPSISSGVQLWFLGTLGAILCRVALSYLIKQKGYIGVVAQVDQRRQEESQTGMEKGRTKSVLMKNARLELAVAWVFTVTLSVFPPLTTAIVSTHRPTPRLLQPAVFIPLHFLIFNVGDYLGRTYLPRLPFLFPTSQSKVLLLSLLRTLFIPLFLFCNVQTTATPSGTPWINSDLIYLLILLGFGLTNGWISSLCMILASSPGLNPRIEDGEKDVAGTLAAFCLVTGLAVGSVASFGVNWVVRGSFV